MANYYTAAIMQPSLPGLTDAEIEFLELFGFTAYPNNDGTVYFATYDYTAGAADEDEQELDESDLERLLQAIIKSSDLKWISIEFSYSCDKLRPDGFGGGASFITADDVQWTSTGQWLGERVQEAELPTCW